VACAVLILGCLALTTVPSASALVVKLNTLILTVPGAALDTSRDQGLAPETHEQACTYPVRHLATALRDS
jgi:hypothetical protein